MQIFKILFDRAFLITRRYYQLYFPYSWLVHGKIRKFRPCFQGPTESIGGYKAQQIIAWARPVSLSPNLTIIFRHLLVRLWFCGQGRLLTHTLRDILSNLFHSKFQSQVFFCWPHLLYLACISLSRFEKNWTFLKYIMFTLNNLKISWSIFLITLNVFFKF